MFFAEDVIALNPNALSITIEFFDGDGYADSFDFGDRFAGAFDFDAARSRD